MNVSELIEFLKTQQQDLPVAFKCYSEAAVLEADEINVVEACEPRADGWIGNRRPDKPVIQYLMFPGN